MIKALIFDFDGLIFDTETPWYLAYKQVLANYGVNLPIEIWGRCIGTTYNEFNPIKYVLEEASINVDESEIHQEAKSQYKLLICDQQLRPGVLEYLRDAKSKGLKTGIATSSKLAWINEYLDGFQIRNYFNVIYSADDVRNVKPDPELYESAIKALEVKAIEVIAFEDSLNGLTAAKRAGANCVVVPNDVTSIMSFDESDFRIQSMKDTPLGEILKKFES
jgi:putative hydrolase of the HAD superfamily